MNSPRLTLTTALLVSASLSLGPGIGTALAQPADLQPGVQTSADAAATSAHPPGAAAAPAVVAPAVAAPRAVARPAAVQSGVARSGASAAGAHHPVAAGSVRAAGASSADRIELGTTEISGNRELPKLMYVVPWRRDQLGNFAGRPPNSLVDEALAPVDRTVFQRQNRYYAALQAASEPAKSQPVTAGAGGAAGPGKDEK